MKKIISVILTIFMLTSLVPTLSFAQDEAAALPVATPDSNGHIMLFDLGNPQTHATAGYQDYAGTPSAFAYKGKSSSLKWEMDKTLDGETYVSNATNLYLPYSDYDLSVYSSSEEATVNVRFYSENVGSKFNIGYYGATTSTYYRKGLTEIVGGWQVYQVLLKDVMAKLTNYPTEKTLRIAFNDDGWNNLKNDGYNDGDTVYIDQIWIDTNPNGYYEGKNVIWNAETTSLNTGTNWTWSKKTVTEPVVNTYQELEMRLGSNGATIKLLGQSGNIISKGSNKWLNAWIYSEKPQDNGFHFCFRSANGTSGTNTRKTISQIDWSGWKLISVAIPSQDVKRLDILGYTYRNNTSTTHNTGDTSGITIGIDNIWVSNETTSPQAAYEAEVAASVGTVNAFSTASGDLLNVNFNTPSSVSGTNASVNGFNSKFYDMSARLAFEGITHTQLTDYAASDKSISNTYKAKLNVFGSDENSENIISVGNDSYINAWIYNPVTKYSFDGATVAEIPIVLGYWNESTAKTSLKKVNIMANWSGWKLVSVPISSISADLVKNGINYIYINPNGGWYPVANSTYEIQTRTADEIAKGWNTGSKVNVFGRYASGMSTAYYNFFNYIDVERVWISTGAPQGAGEVVMADNSALKCPEIAGSDIKLFTATNVGKIDVNVIAKNEDSCTKLDASILNDGTLVLPSDLDFGIDYYVYAEIYAPNGEKTPIELSFSSENYHIEDKETVGKTATITMHGNLTNEYANSVLIAAVYTDETGEELESATVGTVAQDGIVSVTIPENITTDGKKVSFFFVDSIGNIKPLKFNIQK